MITAIAWSFVAFCTAEEGSCVVRINYPHKSFNYTYQSDATQSEDLLHLRSSIGAWSSYVYTMMTI